MNRKYRPFLATGAMIKDLQTIRIFMAERGFYIFTPIPKLRRSKHDFFAGRRNKGIVLFRIGRGLIEIRAYNSLELSPDLLSHLRAKLKSKIRCIRRLRQAPDNDWSVWIDKNQREELDL